MIFNKLTDLIRIGVFAICMFIYKYLVHAAKLTILRLLENNQNPCKFTFQTKNGGFQLSNKPVSLDLLTVFVSIIVN